MRVSLFMAEVWDAVQAKLDELLHRHGVPN